MNPAVSGAAFNVTSNAISNTFNQNDWWTLSWAQRAVSGKNGPYPIQVSATQGATSVWLHSDGTWGSRVNLNTYTNNYFAANRIGVSFQFPASLASGTATTFNLQVADGNTSSSSPQDAIVIGDIRMEPGLGFTYGAPPASNVLTASLTTTVAGSDVVSLPGMTSTGHCSAPAPTNTAAQSALVAFISAKATGQVTVTHATTAGLTYDINCLPY